MLSALFRICRAHLVVAIICLNQISNAIAKRAIPDDNLAYPVLITLKNGSTGSGFYLNAVDTIYLVTAKHVLFDPDTKQLRDIALDLLSYSKDLTESKRNLLTLDISALNNAGNIKAHPSEDVVVVKIALVTPQQTKAEAPQEPSAEKLQKFSFLPGVTLKESALTGLLTVALEGVKTFDQVLVGNEVVMFGYPTSLALVPNPKIDFQRPLLRKGIVAGENPAQRSIILDCPSYQGDSGGPILEVDADSPFQQQFRVIGVMSSFVPFADTWANQHFNYINTTLQNSGYSVVTPMDFVLELVKADAQSH
jgi:V8-like Glu-specific endopeptidase